MIQTPLMTHHNRNSARSAVVAAVLLLTVAVAAGLLFASNFYAGLAYVVVALLAIHLYVFALNVKAIGWGPAYKRALPRTIGVLGVMSVVSQYFIAASPMSHPNDELWTTATPYSELKRAARHSRRIARYREELIASGVGPDSFRVVEVLLLPPADSTGDTLEVRSPERWVRAQQQGFALNVVRFTPLVINADSFIVRADSGSLVLSAARSSALGEVIVSGLPSNSFGQARFVRDVDTASFVGEQQARWKISSTEPVVGFSYVPARYAAWRAVLNPVIGADSVPQWVVGIIGVIGLVAALITASKIAVIAELILPRAKDAVDKESQDATPLSREATRGVPAPGSGAPQKKGRKDQQRGRSGS